MSYKLSVIFLLLSPIMSNYVLIDAFSQGDFLIFLSIICSLPMLRSSIILYISLFFSIFIPICNFFILTSNEMISLSFFRASFFLIAPCFLLSMRPEFYRILLKYYVVASIILSLIVLIQGLSYYIFGLNISLQLPLSVYEEDTLSILDLETQGFRIGGLFKEPSYFAIYTMPAILFFPVIGKIARHMLLTIASIVSTSSLGIVNSFLSFFLYFNNTTIHKNASKTLRYLAAMGIIVVFLLSIIFVIDAPWIDRLLDIFMDGGTLSSRFSPVIDILPISGFGFVDAELNDLVRNSNGLVIWYNSFAYLLSNFGWFFVIPFSIFSFRLGAIGALLIFVLILTTHAFSTSFFTLFFTVILSIKMTIKDISDKTIISSWHHDA